MRDYKQIWQNVIDGLEKAYLPSSIQLWFGDSEIVLIDETKVVISILSILKIETVRESTWIPCILFSRKSSGMIPK